MHADETQYGVCSAPLLPAQGHAHLDHVSDILYFVALLRPTIYLGGDFGWRTYVGLPIVAVQAALGWWKTASPFDGIRREIRCGRRRAGCARPPRGRGGPLGLLRQSRSAAAPPPAADLPYRRRNKIRAGSHRHPAQLFYPKKAWGSIKRILFP